MKYGQYDNENWLYYWKTTGSGFSGLWFCNFLPLFFIYILFIEYDLHINEY